MTGKLITTFSLMMLFTFNVSYASPIEKGDVDRVFHELLKIEKSSLSENLIMSYKSKFSTTVDFYKEKQLKWGNNTKAIERLFYKIHRTYLKNYVPYQSFSKLLSDGTYGCLTATALYALLLEELGYDYEIIETNYHIFLVGEIDGHRFLIESTDPINGFISSSEEISERLKEVAVRGTSPNNEDRYRFSFNINRPISLEEMIGLQYYNMATKSYNEGEYIQAVANLDNAYKYYQSERINEFLLLIVKNIAEDRELLTELNLNKKHYQILATL